MKTVVAPGSDFEFQIKTFINLSPTQGSFKNTIFGHLIIEELIRELVSDRLKKASVIENSNFSFYQICSIAEGLYGDDIPSWILPAAKKLNKIRNQYAHNLNPDGIDDLLNDFNQFVFKESGLKKKEVKAKKILDEKNKAAEEQRKSNKNKGFWLPPERSILDRSTEEIFHRAVLELAEYIYRCSPKVRQEQKV
ncbi:MAG: hypothetical protein PHO08_09520 [Methylococcales bacterium]|nr:hypothetical protein [Methylococcales bacterium]MDD5632214.1 hypothetical protein [Methylococcales bacterium]